MLNALCETFLHWNKGLYRASQIVEWWNSFMTTNLKVCFAIYRMRNKTF